MCTHKLLQLELGIGGAVAIFAVMKMYGYCVFVVAFHCSGHTAVPDQKQFAVVRAPRTLASTVP